MPHTFSSLPSHFAYRFGKVYCRVNLDRIIFHALKAPQTALRGSLGQIGLRQDPSQTSLEFEIA